MNGAAKPTARRNIVSKIIALMAAISVAAGGFFYGQTAFDTYRASTFTPPAAVAAVEGSIKLTPTAQRTFRATQPAIETSDQFNAHCKSTERTAAILGCYYGDRIYLFDVENAELAGAKEVTAAHELLHAQYARLNIFERPKVDSIIKKAYQKVKNDPEIAKAMEYYREAEPGAELDELHSIIGTTIGELDSDLEQYYARYFTDRASLSLKTKLTRQYLPESTPGLKRCNLSCNQPPSKSNKMSKLISPIYRKLTLILTVLMNGPGAVSLVRKLISRWRGRRCSSGLALSMLGRVRSIRGLKLTMTMWQLSKA